MSERSRCVFLGRRRLGWFAVTVASSVVCLAVDGVPAVATPSSLAATGVVAAESTVAVSPERTGVDELSAVAAADGVTVSGNARFVDVSMAVGTDPSGDGLVGTDVAGTDLVAARIARPDPFADMLEFTLDVADMPPVVNGFPENMQYHWQIGVGSDLPLELLAVRTGHSGRSSDVEPVFQVRCGVFCVVAEVPGTMTDGVVRWQVPMQTINATPGRKIYPQIGGNAGFLDSVEGSPREAVYSSLGFYDGNLVLVYRERVDELFVEETYTVPAPTVSLGIASVGTSPELVDLTVAAPVEPGGAFAGTLPTPSEPGEYMVVAKACYGGANCGLSTAMVVVE